MLESLADIHTLDATMLPIRMRGLDIDEEEARLMEIEEEDDDELFQAPGMIDPRRRPHRCAIPVASSHKWLQRGHHHRPGRTGGGKVQHANRPLLRGLSGTPPVPQTRSHGPLPPSWWIRPPTLTSSHAAWQASTFQKPIPMSVLVLW